MSTCALQHSGGSGLLLPQLCDPNSQRCWVMHLPPLPQQCRQHRDLRAPASQRKQASGKTKGSRSSSRQTLMIRFGALASCAVTGRKKKRRRQDAEVETAPSKKRSKLKSAKARAAAVASGVAEGATGLGGKKTDQILHVLMQ